MSECNGEMMGGSGEGQNALFIYTSLLFWLQNSTAGITPSYLKHLHARKLISRMHL
jgi:hypothetical protein